MKICLSDWCTWDACYCWELISIADSRVGNQHESARRFSIALLFSLCIPPCIYLCLHLSVYLSVCLSVLPAFRPAAKLVLVESTESYNVPQAIELSG